MTPEKINRKVLRQRAARKGIFSISELARQIGCSRQAIYFSMERPSRFPNVQNRINELIGAK